MLGYPRDAICQPFSLQKFSTLYELRMKKNIHGNTIIKKHQKSSTDIVKKKIVPRGKARHFMDPLQVLSNKIPSHPKMLLVKGNNER